ncbi:hypothetical protein C6B36_06905 [Helicobacter cinaedi]|nr:hypothetical protein C6B36_06905 [Helicobacter cinaedi]
MSYSYKMITCRYRLSAVAGMSLGFLCLFGKYLLGGYFITAKNLLSGRYLPSRLLFGVTKFLNG